MASSDFSMMQRISCKYHHMNELALRALWSYLSPLTKTFTSQSLPRRIAYFLNELRQPVVETTCRHICNARVQSLYSFFKVFRGKKATGFQSTGPPWSILFPFLEQFTRPSGFISCWFRYCIINTFLLILHTFGCRISRKTLLLASQNKLNRNINAN